METDRHVTWFLWMEGRDGERSDAMCSWRQAEGKRGNQAWGPAWRRSNGPSSSLPPWEADG